MQLALKQQMIQELFGYYESGLRVGMTPADKFFGYRTKVEFSFLDRVGEETVPLSLAFHVRGGGNARLPLPEGCALASESMNCAALLICAKLRDLGYISRDLKTLIIREEKTTGKLIAMLYAKCQEVAQFSVEDIPNLAGCIVFHSTEKSPASVPTKELWRVGNDSLTETINGVAIAYSWDSFFQNNIPVFTQAVDAMRRYVPKGARILELYSGVGTIGLLLASSAKEVHGVEIITAAVEAANQNAFQNGITNYHAECLPAEKMDVELLSDIDVLLLDPPRVGLHPKLLEHIRVKLPPRIIYLSCNPETQARDYSALADLYSIDHIEGFDFYPQTPHCESLLVLSLRKE
jgi:23S rRNA (uracil1939-C5)-methyltransferase